MSSDQICARLPSAEQGIFGNTEDMKPQLAGTGADRGKETMVGEASDIIDFRLKDLRDRLLNLTRSNKLLDTKFSDRSRAHFRVINISPDPTYAAVVEDELEFESLPPLETEPPDERTPEFLAALDEALVSDQTYLAAIEKLEQGEADQAEVEEAQQRLLRELKDRVREKLQLPLRASRAEISLAEHARLFGIDPSFDLAPRPRQADADGHLRLLMLPDTADRKLSGLHDLARSYEQETGINTLYLAFGFLEWRQSTDSDRKLYAPLMLLPVRFRRLVSGGAYVYRVKALDEDAQDNVTLKELLARDFRLDLPSIIEDETPEEYWRRISETILPRQPQWQVRRWVAIGTFPFARIAMYFDLANEDGAVTQQDLVRSILSGAGSDAGIEPADESELDTPEVDQEPVLITDADSSQHCAVLDVCRGRNLVIKGPPGTGKSQTITNIIGAALDRGETILFVAEKLTALEVVYKRLRQAKLDRFCLRLHSDKASRKEVAHSFKQRLEHEAVTPPARIDAKLQQLRKHKERLNTYVRRLNAIYGKSGVTARYILGDARRLEERAPVPPVLARVPLYNPAEISADDLEQADLQLASLKKAFSDCFSGEVTPATHPWRGLKRTTLTPFDIDRIVDDAKQGEAASARAMAAASAVNGADPQISASSPAEIKSLLITLDKVADVTAQLASAPLGVLLDFESRRVVDGFIADLDRYQRAMEILAEAGLRNAEPRALEDLNSAAKELGLSSAELGEIPNLIEGKSRSLLLLEHILRPIREAAKIIGIENELTLSDARDLIDAAAMVRSAQTHVLGARNPAIADAEAASLLSKADQLAQDLLTKQQEISQQLRVDADVDADELERHASEIEGKGIALFSRGIRAANRCFEGVYRGSSKVRRPERARSLRRLAAHIRAVGAFESDKRYEVAAGHQFLGIKTDFKRLHAAAVFIVATKQRFVRSHGTHALIRRFLIEGDSQALITVGGILSDCSLDALSSRVSDNELPLEQALTSLRGELRDLRMLADAVNSIGNPRRTIRFRDLKELAHLSANVAEKSKELERRADSINLPDLIDGLETRTDQLRTAVAVAKRAATLPDVAQKLAVEGAEKVKAIRKLASSAIYECESAAGAFATMAADETIDSKAFFDGETLEDMSFADLLARSRLCAAGRDTLLAWANWERRHKEIAARSLKRFVDAGLSAGIPPSTLAETYRTYVRRHQAQDACQRDPLLVESNGADQETTRKLFQQLDLEIQDLQRQRVVARLLKRRVPTGVGGGRVSDYTDLALIEKEATKQKRHVPVRQLLSRAREAALALTPCFMMSPLSIAQYLKRGEFTFDLLVVDEASQMPPEDGIGAIARAKQLCVVGDEQQLAPTDFFTRSTLRDDVAEGLEDERILHESLLDRALAVFRQPRELRWHYRSRHPSLISFSNRHFYDDKLVVFPAAADSDPTLGIELDQVAGLYGGQINPEEASVVVSAALDFMRDRPDESLGIVTVNQPQQELIREELDRLAANDTDAAAYMKRWQTERDGLEPLFVKNLERVQGDERDVIFISTVYGPPRPGGVVAQHFGPINGAAGHRRLNVLFSRAKRQIKLFTSMRPADVRPDNQSRRGVHILKAYLEYAATGRLEAGVASTNTPESPFEEMVIDRIRALGFEAVPQVGVQHFRIDIGVKHPEYPYGYLLGIECDGATYHSAASARDRDRLRQHVLEDLGWRLCRIWSTDWFRDPVGQSDKLRQVLLSRLNEAVKEMPRSRTARKRPTAQILPLLLPRASHGQTRAEEPAEPQRLIQAEPVVEVQDSVVYAFKTDPERHITITITHRTHDPDRGFLAKGHPVVRELLGAKKGDEVLVPVGGAQKAVIVLEIIKPGQEAVL